MTLFRSSYPACLTWENGGGALTDLLHASLLPSSTFPAYVREGGGRRMESRIVASIRTTSLHLTCLMSGGRGEPADRPLPPPSLPLSPLPTPRLLPFIHILLFPAFSYLYLATSLFLLKFTIFNYSSPSFSYYNSLITFFISFSLSIPFLFHLYSPSLSPLSYTIFNLTPSTHHLFFLFSLSFFISPLSRSLLLSPLILAYIPYPLPHTITHFLPLLRPDPRKYSVPMVSLSTLYQHTVSVGLVFLPKLHRFCSFSSVPSYSFFFLFVLFS